MRRRGQPGEGDQARRCTGVRSFLFPATRSGDGGELRYQSLQERWQGCAQTAGVECTLHQMRHTHATALAHGGVSPATIRKVLGHASIQTTLRRAELADDRADQEMREWRRKA